MTKLPSTRTEIDLSLALRFIDEATYGQPGGQRFVQYNVDTELYAMTSLSPDEIKRLETLLESDFVESVPNE